MTRKMLYGFAISLLFAPTGVVAQDADSIARSMSNPTAAVSGLASSFDFTTYTGALPGADARTGWSYQLQPVFPFPLESGANILFRPAIPIIFDRPVSDGTGFEGSGIKFGDVAFDLAYGKTTSGGTLILGGLAGSVPTGAEGVSTDEVALGPEVVLGMLRQWGVVGFIASQRWGVTGDKDVNALSIQYFYAVGLGGGWQLTGSPIVTFNRGAADNNKWAIPIGVGLSRTTIAGATPLKISFQVQKCLEKPEAFSPNWIVKFSITPVIKLPWG